MSYTGCTGAYGSKLQLGEAQWEKRKTAQAGGTAFQLREAISHLSLSRLNFGERRGSIRLEGGRGQFHEARPELFLLQSLLTAHALHFYSSSMVFQVFFAGLFIAGIKTTEH